MARAYPPSQFSFGAFPAGAPVLASLSSRFSAESRRLGSPSRSGGAGAPSAELLAGTADPVWCAGYMNLSSSPCASGWSAEGGQKPNR